MTERPIAVSTGAFYNCPIFEVLELFPAAGFTAIEVCSSPRHLDYHSPGDLQRARRQMDALSLRPISFHAPFAPHIDITSLDDQARESSVKELLRACEAASIIGCAHLVLHPGPEREGRPPQEEFLAHMRHASVSLNRVAEKCCELGIELLLENMLAHLLFGHVSDMLFLLGEIHTCSVGVCLDTGHAHLAGQMDVVVQKLSGHLKLVHVNDNHRDWDAHLAPGEGSINWHKVMADLRQSHFHGPFVLELARRGSEPPAEFLSRASRARDFMRMLDGAAQ